jgi:hypothetical protein
MKIKIISLAILLFANSAFSLEFCPDEEAIEEGGFLKTIEVCEYEQIETNLRTECRYEGKLWGSLGGKIYRETTSHAGHSACASSLYEHERICGPEECEIYSGYLPLRNQTFTADYEQVKIEGSCYTDRIWVYCKP